ncbi:trypsin-like peptidase domain-containing protein [Undibacterium umbellatum]|uniref:Trypsin-like peptidase domain-containing protein n=1 Tax=Undibacterium umbellatum TaxID=2762300 RepID=A0ABR6ZA54_9BURK|nr:trypsin-like peptidase domain-containing protein [Undibacterium umbellatum]MBC3908456.1 trypsin-like peptidase domain-containing protein [Undibacterium umbellatum]
MKQTLYDILSVPADATPEQIRAAYQHAMSELESTAQHDPNKKVILREAYELLTTPQKRASYDARLARQESLRAQASIAREQQPTAPAKPKNWFSLIALMVVLAAAATWWSINQKEERDRQKELPVYSKVTPASPVKPPLRAVVPAPPSQIAEPAATNNNNVEGSKTAEEIYALRSPSIALITVFSPTGAPVSMGSGVMIAPEVLITNCHVTRSGVQYKARIGKQLLAATVIMADEEYDLCRLSVPGANAPAVALGSTDGLRIGQKVFAIGAPLGLDLTISDGIVSALRPLPTGKVIQTTAPISPGSSGGGLFDAAGKLVGINTFNLQHRQAQNLNFAVPADWINTMSSRRASNESLRALTMNSIEGNREGNKDNNQYANAQTSTAQQALTKILGTWNCYGVLTGYSMDVMFERDSRMSGTMNGKKFSGNYLFDGKTLSLSMGSKASGIVEEFTGNKLVVNAGKADRLVCHRR